MVTTADTSTATFHPAARSGPEWVAMMTNMVIPTAAPTYLAVLFAPLPIAARSGGTLATASLPSSALSTPVARPATIKGGTRRHGLEDACNP